MADLGLALGDRASNSSLDPRRPAVMSRPATPPVWNVRIVSWVRLADRLGGDDPDGLAGGTICPLPGCGRSTPGDFVAGFAGQG
jgi:hypothetical protein